VKAHGIEPCAYFKTLFAELRKAGTLEDVEALLPIVETSATQPQRVAGLVQ
jgi:hypothetical protein